MSDGNVVKTAPQYSETVSFPWRFYVGWGLAVLLGLVWLVAGVIKALEPFEFVRQVAGFQLIPGKAAQTTIAWALLVTECTLGAALILGYRLRWALVAAGCLTLIFMGALGWVIVAGIPVEDCGCFGSQIKRSPKEALLEDSLMLMATVVSGWLVWPSRPGNSILKPHRWRGLGVLLGALFGLLTPLAFGFPLGGGDWSQIKVSGTTVNVAAGERLVALLDTECSHCQESVPKLNAYVNVKDFPQFVALCSNEEWRRKFFIQRFEAKFELGEISKDDFKRLLADGDTPRIVLLRQGRVLAVWDGAPPSLDEVRRARTAGKPR
ncbi:MAG: MauE/DoxX family redox-associated membrane protein [Acidobacteriota bacterium]